MNDRKNIRWKAIVREALQRRDGPACRGCGRPDEIVITRNAYGDQTQRSVLDIDHITPLIDGGVDSFANLQLLCIACHKVKTLSERTARRGRRS